MTKTPLNCVPFVDDNTTGKKLLDGIMLTPLLLSIEPPIETWKLPKARLPLSMVARDKCNERDAGTPTVQTGLPSG
jgi:hypothetical protein